MQGNGKDALRLMRMAVTDAAEVKRFDVQLRALNERLAIEQQWGEGQHQQTLRDIERLVNTSALDLPAAAIAWTHGFFAAWNGETAEKHVRDGIRLAVDAGRYGDLSHLYICLVLVLIRASRVCDAQAASANVPGASHVTVDLEGQRCGVGKSRWLLGRTASGTA